MNAHPLWRQPSRDERTHPSANATRFQDAIKLRFAPASAIAAQFVYGAVIASAWPDTKRVALLAALHIGRFVVFGAVVLVLRRLTSPRAQRNSVLFMGLVTIIFGLAMAHVASWSIAAHLSIPFGVLALTTNLYERGRAAGRVYVALAAALALADGAPLSAVAGLIAGCVAVQVLTETRATVLTELISLAETQRDELAVAKEGMARLHARAVEQEKLSSLGVLSAGIAHEINNPMSYVTANLDELVMELQVHRAALPNAFSAAADELMGATLDGVGRVNTIVGDLRRYAREELEKDAAFDLHAQVQASVRMCRSTLRERVTLQLDLEPDGLVLYGRPNQIAQLIINLLVNAAQAVARDGHVCLTTRVVGADVAISVEDNGCGMSAETAARIFEPFFTTKTEGTGLGLAVVQGIARSHGGRIEVDSVLGRGTKVTVILPVRPSHSRGLVAA